MPSSQINMKISSIRIALVTTILTLMAISLWQCGTKVEETADPTAIVEKSVGLLETKLAEQREKSLANAPPEVLMVGQRAREALQASGILESALNVGDTAPAFALANAVGDTVSSGDLLESGPMVLTFYRGYW